MGEMWVGLLDNNTYSWKCDFSGFTTLCYKRTNENTHHHEVELTVGRADGLEHKDYLAKLATGHPWKRGWDPDTETQTQIKTLEKRRPTNGKKQPDFPTQVPWKHPYLLEAGHMQREDEIVIIRTAGSTANVVPCDLPSWWTADMTHSRYTSFIPDYKMMQVCLLQYILVGR